MEKTLNQLTQSTLSNNQKTGTWPVMSSELLATKYVNRYEMGDKLFAKMDSDLFEAYNSTSDEEVKISEWRDDDIPDKIWSLKHEGPVFGYDVDYMIGPKDWWRAEDDPLVGDYVERRKFYIYPWSAEKFNFDDPMITYFTDMHKDFSFVLDEVYANCFKDQHEDIEKTIYKLMVIQYNTPTATEKNRTEHRAHNTERFGPDHCDETLGGLHLGENYAEFEAYNNVKESWEGIPGLTENKMLWMFGEHAERSGWQPTYHRMIHNSDPELDTRYSIIFDLQARYKES